MVKHIVMWNLKDNAEGCSKEENIEIMRDKLLALKEMIPEIISMEVGVNFNLSDTACDICLVTEFKSGVELGIYTDHPEHVEVAKFVGKVRESRVVADYVI